MWNVRPVDDLCVDQSGYDDAVSADGTTLHFRSQLHNLFDSATYRRLYLHLLLASALLEFTASRTLCIEKACLLAVHLFSITSPSPARLRVTLLRVLLK